MSRTSPRYGDTVRVGNNRIESHYLRFIGDQLKRFQDRKRRLRELEEGIIKATSIMDTLGMPRGSDPGNPTQGAAWRLMDEKEPTFAYRSHLRGWIAAIDEVYKSLPVEHQQIIKQIYWDRRFTLYGVGRNLHMSRQSVNLKRNEALVEFAIKLIGDHILIPAGPKD